MGYSSIVWLPICAGLTALGLILSYVIGRRRGHLAVLRGAAWSLLPLAAYLTGSVEMFFKIGDAIGHYADGFVFSPVKWAGIGVAGLSVLLFFSTGGRGRRKAVRAARKASREDRKNAAAGSGGTAAVGAAGQPHGATQALDTLALDTKAPATIPAKSAAPAKSAKPGKGGKKASAADGGDDMKDIEAILRERGL